MASVTDKGNWRDSLINQLQIRNQELNSPFMNLLRFHTRIFESWNSLKNENSQLTVQNEMLRVGGSSAAVTALEKKLLEQAEELAELHKNRGENANHLVSLNEKLRSMENTLEQKNEKIADMKKQEMLLKQEMDAYHLIKDQTESKFQMLKDEYQALQLTSTHLEEKLKKVQTENFELIERLKEYKSKDAEKMNQENENFIRKKNAMVQKELAEAARDTRFNMLDDVAVDALTINPGTGPGSLPNSPQIIWDAHDGEVNSVQFSPGSDSFLATGGTDRKVKLWDTTRGQAFLKCSLLGSNKGIMSVDFDPSGTLLLGTSADGAIRVWGIAEQRPRNSLTGHSSKVLAAKFFGEQTKVVSGGYDRTIKIWDLTKYACVETRFTHSYCHDLVVSDSSARTIISGHYDKTVKFWDNRASGGVHGNEPVDTINLGDRVTSLSLSCDGGTLMACVKDGSLKIIDLRRNVVLRSLEAEGFLVRCDWTRAAFSANSEYAAAGSQDGTIFIWNTLTGKLEKTLKQHQNEVIAVAWHPYLNNYLASVDKCKKAIFWAST